MFPHLFPQRSRKNKQETIDVTETVRTLIEARIDRLEQNFDSLRLEQKDMLDKVLHLYDRVRKRVKKSEVAPEEQKPTQPIPEPISLTERRERILDTFIRQNGL